MSDINALREKLANLTPEQLEKIGGGCTLQEWLDATAQVQDAYENLVDFTSHVIERVVGP